VYPPLTVMQTSGNLHLPFCRRRRTLAASRLLPTRAGRGTLRSDLLRLELSLESDDSDLDRIKPLPKAVLAHDSDNTLVWTRVYDAVTAARGRVICFGAKPPYYCLNTSLCVSAIVADCRKLLSKSHP
jgi:hypothetical protein